MAIQFKSHGWEIGHPMLEGICMNCGFDDDICDCKEFKCATCQKSHRNEKLRHRCHD